MISVTADTNIYISGLHFGRAPRRFLNLAEVRGIRLDVSEPILTEIATVLAYAKFGWAPERITQALQQIRRYASLVQVTQGLEGVSRDSDDNRILECAAAASSDYLVTGDQDLLSLGRYEATRIVPLTEFMSILQHDPPGAVH